MELTHRNAGPRLVLGVDEFAACAKRADEIGKWNAWRDVYFEPFEKAFRPMLEVVYRCSRDDLKPYVEALDFEAAEREPTMRADVRAHWDRSADREMIVRFIESGTAYLVGGCMIAGLIEDGGSIAELTRTPTAEIARRIVDRDEPAHDVT